MRNMIVYRRSITPSCYGPQLSGEPKSYYVALLRSLEVPEL